MDDILKVNIVGIEGDTIKYSYEISEKWNNYIQATPMFIKYNLSIENVPKSIAIIPLICNLLPIMWINNLTIRVEELDKVFYEQIPKIKKGYQDMYPDIKFLGNLEVKSIVENKYEYKKNAVMFSGGVDAFNTLFNHIEELPDLITIFGADIDLKDTKGIKSVDKYNKELAEKFGLGYNGIYSNFRNIVKYHENNCEVSKINNYEWWHDFQHGIALLGLTAPLAYEMKYKIIYIASSFTSYDIGNYTCASDPTIDNNFAHSSARTVHDGYEFRRQDKIQNICNYIEKNNLKINIRACWENKGGNNCCDCEKCYRTIMGIIAEDRNPYNFGFELTKKKRRKMIRFLKRNLKYRTNQCNRTRYKPIQNRLKLLEERIPKDLKWFANVEIDSQKQNAYNVLISFIDEIRRKIRKRIRYYSRNIKNI